MGRKYNIKKKLMFTQRKYIQDEKNYYRQPDKQKLHVPSNHE